MSPLAPPDLRRMNVVLIAPFGRLRRAALMTTGRNTDGGTLPRLVQPLLSAMVLLALVLFSSNSLAFAPMCDESGATILAPLPAPPSNDGEILSMPCPEDLPSFERLHSGVPSEAPGQPAPASSDLSALVDDFEFEYWRAVDVVRFGAARIQPSGLEYRLGRFRPPQAR